jgi:two-component system sensor histidine kinase QseC
MPLSIRKFLLFNLLLSITIATLLTAVGNYFLDQRDIQRHLDEQLSQVALSFEAIIEEELHSHRLEEMQRALNEIPRKANAIYETLGNNEFDEPYEDKFHFQVWNSNGKLLLRSNSAPDEPLSDGITGFSERIIDSQPWRVFTVYSSRAQLSIVVAERYETRSELEHRIAQDETFIMLLIYPLLGMMIWVIVGRGLSSLKRIAHEVSHRAPHYLEPVNLEEVPLEIIPVIDELNKLFLRLQEAFERDKRFAADAAHELRTPLAVLRTQAKFALKTTDGLERQQALQKVIQGVDRSTHVVQQLLTLSRLTPDINRITNPQNVVLDRVAADVIATLAPLAVEKQLDIELLLTSNEPFLIKGDPTAISILIRNLVDNAIRYTPPKGRVEVAVTQTDRTIELNIIDSGPGIPEELRGRVFERFYRIIGTQEQGSGLGLAIVNQIAAFHAAKVSLSTPSSGHGLCVRVSFPRLNL